MYVSKLRAASFQQFDEHTDLVSITVSVQAVPNLGVLHTGRQRSEVTMAGEGGGEFTGTHIANACNELEIAVLCDRDTLMPMEADTASVTVPTTLTTTVIAICRVVASATTPTSGSCGIATT